MFLHLSLSHSVHRGVCATPPPVGRPGRLGRSPGYRAPRQTPLGQTSLDADPPDADPPLLRPPLGRPASLDADPLPPPTLPIRQQAGVRHASYWNAYLFFQDFNPSIPGFFPVFQGYCDFSSFPGRVGTPCKQHKIFGLRIGGGQLKIHQFNFVFKTINLQHPTHKENFQTLASDCTYMTIIHWTVIKLVDGGIVRPIQSHRFHLEVFAVVVRQIGAAG